MKKKHSFNFDGGKTLSKMGASWFVSYTYYLVMDMKHINWYLCKTVKMRRSFYSSSFDYHNLWLEEILKMNPSRLTSNLLKLKGNEVIKMAKEIIEKSKKYS